MSKVNNSFSNKKIFQSASSSENQGSSYYQIYSSVANLTSSLFKGTNKLCNFQKNLILASLINSLPTASKMVENQKEKKDPHFERLENSRRLSKRIFNILQKRKKRPLPYYTIRVEKTS